LYLTSESLEKISVGPKGKRVYAGGKGLYIFERESKEGVDPLSYKVLNYDGNEKKRFFSLKATRSGHLVMQMANSNDIIVTDAIGDELTRNHGYQQAIFGR
jgi:hypothetical protein